jgi:hypothetical protein
MNHSSNGATPYTLEDPLLDAVNELAGLVEARERPIARCRELVAEIDASLVALGKLEEG